MGSGVGNSQVSLIRATKTATLTIQFNVTGTFLKSLQSAGQEIPVLLKRKAHSRVHRSPLLTVTLSHNNLVHPLRSCSYKINFHVSSHLR